MTLTSRNWPRAVALPAPLLIFLTVRVPWTVNSNIPSRTGVPSFAFGVVAGAFEAGADDAGAAGADACGVASLADERLSAVPTMPTTRTTPMTTPMIIAPAPPRRFG